MANTVDLGDIGQLENSSRSDILLRKIADGNSYALPIVDEDSPNIDKLLKYIIDNGGIGGGGTVIPTTPTTPTRVGVWYNNTFQPDAQYPQGAIVGDYYLNTNDKKYYVKEINGWRELGTLQGIDGADGTQWHRGTIDPDKYEKPFDSNPGDFYLNWKTSDYFVKQDDNTWKKLGNLQGIPGVQGAQGKDGQRGAKIYADNKKPTATDLLTGDIWFNTEHGDISVYDVNQKQNNDGWIFKHNIRGHMWYVGAGEPTGKTEVVTAKAGEWYFNTQDNSIWRTTDGKVWSKIIDSIKGTAGAQGQPGVAGKDGATWHVGTQQPAIANEGDFYLDGNGQIFKMINTSWVNQNINIKGDKGEPGQAGTGGVGTPGQNGKDGATWIVGNVNPNTNSTPGKDGDLYLDNVSWNVYKYETNQWTALGSIKGNDGAPGKNGTNATLEYKINPMSGGELQTSIEKNGWSVPSGQKAPVYIRNGRMIFLEGAISYNGSPQNLNYPGQLIFTIPSPGTRPTGNLTFPVASGQSPTSLDTTGFITVGTNGEIRLIGGSHRYVSLSGITWLANGLQ